MKALFWVCAILCSGGLISILFGTWFLLGGPYIIAYTLLVAGAGLLCAGVALPLFDKIRRKAKN